MTDACSANMLCERILGEEAPRQRRAVLHLLCDAHRIAIIQSQYFDLFKPCDTRVFRLALSLDGVGLELVRRQMRAIISEQLVVYVGGQPTTEATQHRTAVYDMYFGTAPKDKKQRAIAEGLFNGDVRRCGTVEHYEVGCCTSRAQTLQLMLTCGIAALLGKRIPVMARSNWSGADKAADAVGLPSAMHGLLATAYIRAFHDETESKARGARAAAERGEEELGDVPVGGGEGGGGEEDGEAAGGRADESKDSDSFWHEDAKNRRQSTMAWALKGRMADDIAIVRIGHKPQSLRMLQQLSLTGEKWEQKQQANVVTKGSREYQVGVAFEGKSDLELLASCSDLMFNPDKWLAMQSTTEQRQVEAFKGAARTMAARYEASHRRHRSWPLKLFGMLQDPRGIADELAATSDCLLDSFSLGFKQHYSHDLCGEAALAEIETLAAVCQTDTSTTEQWHSRNQRRARFRVWSHSQDLPSLSAHFLGRRGRCPDREGHGAASSQGEVFDAAAEAGRRRGTLEGFRSCAGEGPSLDSCALFTTLLGVQGLERARAAVLHRARAIGDHRQAARRARVRASHSADG